MSMRDVKVAKQELMFTEVDCQKLFLQESVPEEDDYGDEILAEILEEEKARKAAREEEEGGSTKKGGKKKGKKGKKKKGKKDVNDEL